MEPRCIKPALVVTGLKTPLHTRSFLYAFTGFYPLQYLLHSSNSGWLVFARRVTVELRASDEALPFYPRGSSSLSRHQAGHDPTVNQERLLLILFDAFSRNAF